VPEADTAAGVAGVGSEAAFVAGAPGFRAALRIGASPSADFSFDFEVVEVGGSRTAVAAPEDAAEASAEAAWSPAPGAPPTNHSRMVWASPKETADRWFSMSGMSSDLHRATMSLEPTPSSFAS
jgi:hypothetical protein